MGISGIVIDDENYEIVATTKIDNIKYIVYSKDDCVYVSEYEINEDNMTLKSVDQETLERILDILDIKHDK